MYARSEPHRSGEAATVRVVDGPVVVAPDVVVVAIADAARLPAGLAPPRRLGDDPRPRLDGCQRLCEGKRHRTPPFCNLAGSIVQHSRCMRNTCAAATQRLCCVLCVMSLFLPPLPC